MGLSLKAWLNLLLAWARCIGGSDPSRPRRPHTPKDPNLVHCGGASISRAFSNSRSLINSMKAAAPHRATNRRECQWSKVSNSFTSRLPAPWNTSKILHAAQHTHFVPAPGK
ncbi:hypothetical protein DFS34DRAFT_611099 [Phlyctochytrium arcticum]|nr:hypothetical protein DFS34DRAFT_611099 [Phlyctochytrium arcticum]